MGARHPATPASRSTQLRIWDIKHNAVMVPEVDACRLIHPMTLPGIASGFSPHGRQVQRSFFAYRFHDYRSGLGVRESARPGSCSEQTCDYITVLRNITEGLISV